MLIRKNHQNNAPRRLRRLPDKMIYNGQEYTLLKRTETVALFSIDGGFRFEVSRIYILPPVYFEYVYYPFRETISDNNQFGRDGSKYFNTLEQAMAYFEKLNRIIKVKEECEITVDDRSDFDSEIRNNITLDEKVSENRLQKNTSDEKKGSIRRLKQTFKKNGHIYSIVERNDRVVLFKLILGDEIVGYEVCIIKILPEEEILGKHYPARESIPSDDEFGTEGSKSFFGHEYERALKYFQFKSSQ